MLRNYVTKMVYFIVFSLILELIIPTNKYKKYYDLCKGFIMITIILNPIISMISSGLDIDSINFNDMYFLEKKEFCVAKEILTKKQNDMILKIYLKNIEDKIDEMLNEMDIKLHDINIHINENRKDDMFGNIEKIELKVYLNNREKNKKKARLIGLNQQKIKDMLSKNFLIPSEKIYVKTLN